MFAFSKTLRESKSVSEGRLITGSIANFSTGIEFNDDSFTETTTDGASTVKYRAIENVYVANGKAIYIHLNKMLAYILPESTFECSDQFNAFLQFLSTKTDKINLQ